MSDEIVEDDKAKVLAAFGGKRGLLDSGLPSIGFLIAFNISHNLNKSAVVAIGIAVIFTVIRIVKRETLLHIVSGLFGIVICALFARHTHKAADYYLPGLWINVIYAIIYSLTNIAGWPLLGMLLGPILGENLEWRKVPARKRAYINAGWLWVSLFVLRIAVQYPLYKTNHVNWLGSARLAMGYPLFGVAGWGSWLILRRVPTVKPEAESQSEAD